MGLNYYASAPVLIPQPQPPHHHQSHQSCFSYNPNVSPQFSSSLYPYQQQFAFSAPSSFKPFASPLIRNLRPSKSSVAGHKRSRNDLTAEEDGSEEIPTAPTSVPLPLESQSINGPSMTYNFPSQPGPSNSSSHIQTSNGWTEGQQKSLQGSSSFSQRPKTISRKTQRMSQPSNELDQPKFANCNSNGNNVAIDDLSHSRESSINSIYDNNCPTIDAASQVLGVSWTRLMGDPALEAAARGWARYIANNFMLTDVQILLHSKSDRDGGYLVRAFMDGELRYCRFSEDLDWFQTVGVTKGDGMTPVPVPAQTEDEALACVRQTPLLVLEKLYTRNDRIAMTAVIPSVAVVSPAISTGTMNFGAAAVLENQHQAQAQAQAQVDISATEVSNVVRSDDDAMMQMGNRSNEDNDLMMEMTL